MRATPSRLALAIVLAFLFLALSLQHAHYIDLPRQLPQWTIAKSKPQTGHHAGHTHHAHGSVRTFWATYAEVFHENRPKVGKVKLTNDAGNIPPGKEAGNVRQPHLSYLDISNDEVNSLRTSHASFLKELDRLRPEDEVNRMYNGTGVVMVGGGEYFAPAIVGIHYLRKSGSTLPVEVFVQDEEEYEDEVCETVLPALNAHCFVLADFLSPPSNDSDTTNPGLQKGTFQVTHYQLKSLALLFSSFRHVLYLDSDSIPLVSPTPSLFSTDPYRTTGFVGWPDFWIGSEAPAFYTIAGLSSYPTNLPTTSSEAGQLLLDKSKHMRTLLLATYYNIYGPSWYYPLLSQGALGQGDKNTFESAAVVLGAPYYRVGTPVQAVSRYDAGRVRGSGMVQFHPADDFAVRQALGFGVHNNTLDMNKIDQSEFVEKVRPAFMHANTPKMNAGHLVDEGDLRDKRTKARLRLWGSREAQVELFGIDLEKEVWELMVDVGCNLSTVIKEWKHRKGMCKRLNEHFKEVFEAG